MKNIYLVIFAMLISVFSLYSQRYVDFAPIGAEWLYENQSNVPGTMIRITYMKDSMMTIVTSNHDTFHVNTKLLDVHFIDNDSNVLETSRYKMNVAPSWNNYYQLKEGSAFHIVYAFEEEMSMRLWNNYQTQEYNTTVVGDIKCAYINSRKIHYNQYDNYNANQCWNFFERFYERIGSLSYFLPIDTCHASQTNNIPYGKLISYRDNQLGTFIPGVTAIDENCTPGPTSIGQKSGMSFNISVYPNPAKGKLNIRTSEKISSFTIADLTGRVVFESATGPGEHFDVDVSNLSNGIYIVRFLIEGNIPANYRIMVDN